MMGEGYGLSEDPATDSKLMRGTMSTRHLNNMQHDNDRINIAIKSKLNIRLSMEKRPGASLQSSHRHMPLHT